ncbi:MAG: hypothetical protein DHS20C16_05230 [Phycisphaerae bacterium]|nr:MAG: hypothetical protein DHS20C16_05230 [Phycisphaerae bacterium]
MVPLGGVVNVFIQGRIQNPTDFGLALWSVNLSDTGASGVDVTSAVFDSPGGDIDQFKRNLGLTNPSGYGGTPIAGNLIQIGGGQNTIGNTGPTLFPVGTVVTDVANGAAWVNLATGQIDTTAAFGDPVLTLDTGFASTLASDTGPFFPVSPAIVTIGGSLTFTCGPPDFDFIQVSSVGNHEPNGSFSGGSLDIPINAADGAPASELIEPRQFAGIGPGGLKVRVDFAEAIASGAVTSTPPLGSLTATPVGNSIEITFDAPANGTCYEFDISGTESVGGGVIGNSGCSSSADTDFCICYFEGDINYDGIVNLGDHAVVAAPANFFNTMDAGGITGPQVDLNRDGIMNLGDRFVVAQPSNLFNDFSASACP